MLEPSYAMYAVYCEIFQAKAVPVSFNEKRQLDLEDLLKKITRGVRLVLIANPNQPTGTLLSTHELRRILSKAARVRALVLLDEAYYPFSSYTALPLLKSYPHLIVLRTLSKAAGLAGLRVAYAASHPSIIQNLFKVRAANDINSIAIYCAQQVLAHPRILQDYAAEVKAGGRILTKRMKDLGFVPYKTHTNFMLIKVDHRVSPARLIAQLKKKGYLVKGPFTHPGLKPCIRVTLGPPRLMVQFSDVVARIMRLEEKARG